MKTKNSLLIILLAVLPAFALQHAGAQEMKKVYLDFESVTTGRIPQGWKTEATNQRGPLATWQVREEKNAPSGKKVLALTRTNHTSGSSFNLCWTDNISFINGAISVMIKANEGEEDQGGGVIWRARDKDSYYIARYNPLEDNFRIYYVKDGDRRMLASARLHIPAHKWFSLKITMDGDLIRGYLNGKKYLEVKDDTFKNAGGVGLWVKADGKTSFDDFSVEGK